MKKFLILLSAGTAFALASCSHSSGSCCGECGGDSASKCCADGKCDKCEAKKD